MDTIVEPSLCLVHLFLQKLSVYEPALVDHIISIMLGSGKLILVAHDQYLSNIVVRLVCPNARESIIQQFLSKLAHMEINQCELSCEKYIDYDQILLMKSNLNILKYYDSDAQCQSIACITAEKDYTYSVIGLHLYNEVLSFEQLTELDEEYNEKSYYRIIFPIQTTPH